LFALSTVFDTLSTAWSILSIACVAGPTFAPTSICGPATLYLFPVVFVHPGNLGFEVKIIVLDFVLAGILVVIMRPVFSLDFPRR
jgi:hypothetical protein